jgi:hypothetical protein
MMKHVVIACLLITAAFMQNLSLAAAQTSVTLYPVADNYVDGKYPTRAYGHDSFLFVGNKYDRAQDVWGSERIYIRFDLTELPKKFLVAGATLRLWQYYAPSVNQTYEAHRVLAKWNETTETWDNQPAWAAAVTSVTVAPAKTEVAVEWDITSDVKAWRDGGVPNYGTMIKVAEEQRCEECKDASSGFWSREYPVDSHEEWRPKLVVTLEANPALTYAVSLNIAGLPATLAAAIQVDDHAYGSAASGKEERIGFDPGTSHNITVSRIVPSSTGVRYVCDANQVRVSGPATLVFNYRVEYMIAFSTDPANLFETPATGWYEAGDKLSFKHTGPTVIDAAPGSRLVFNAWSVNSRKITAESASITVSEPVTVVGQYDTEYYLNITSPIGQTEGSGWYVKDGAASFSIDRTAVPAEGFLGLVGVRRLFTGWVGSTNFLGVVTEAHGSVLMKEPTRIKAVWQDDWSSLLFNLSVLILIVAVVGVVAALRIRKRRSQVPVASKSPILGKPKKRGDGSQPAPVERRTALNRSISR